MKFLRATMLFLFLDICMGSFVLLVLIAMLTSCGGPQQGSRGRDGTNGVAGVDGKDGAQGPTGPVGQKGDPGIQGPEGQEGPQGAEGSPGSAGAEGPKGDIGSPGPEGPEGVAGPQGPVGPEGPEGKVGPAGADAITEVIDPCGPNPHGVDELLFVTKSGIMAWYQNVGLVILKDGAYRTTDSQSCLFSIVGGKYHA